MRIPDALRKPRTIVEIFIIGNLAFLAIDVYVAHLTNAFERRPEWLPVIFSIAAPILIMINNCWLRWLPRFASLLVGGRRMLYHLQWHFFAYQTIRNLVYTAPFVAPL